jgi:hypothetical protein
MTATRGGDGRPACARCRSVATRHATHRITGESEYLCEEHAAAAQDGDRGVLLRRLTDAERTGRTE